MLRAIILLQLTIWATTIHAFFPWVSDSLCKDYNICNDDASKRSEADSQVPPAARAPSADAEGVAFELSQRIPDTSEPLESRVSRSADRLARKYSRTQSSRTQDLSKKANKIAVVSASLPAATNAVGINQDGTDFSYFVQVAFGANPKPLNMLLDSGAGGTWVMGTNCQTAACKMHTQYGAGDSKTYQQSTKSFDITYGSGKVAGFLATDAMAFAGLKVSMAFGAANTTSDDFTHFPFDGILGLSMAKGQTDNFMQAVQAQKLLKANMFSVAISRNSDGPNTGEVMFGATNPSKFTGDIKYTPVSDKANGDWAIPMDDLVYDGKKAGVTGKLAYIDTGTTFIFGPPDDVAAIHKQIPGAKTTDRVTYTVPCANSKPISVSFSGVSYTISPKDWLSGSTGDCTSNIYGKEVVAGSWLLGDSFLKNVYAVFDMDQKRIGFATRPAPSTPATTPAAGTSSSTVSASSTIITPQPGPGFSGVTPAGSNSQNPTGTAAAETASPTEPHNSPAQQIYVSIIFVVAAFAIAV